MCWIKCWIRTGVGKTTIQINQVKQTTNWWEGLPTEGQYVNEESIERYVSMHIHTYVQ